MKFQFRAGNKYFHIFLDTLICLPFLIFPLFINLPYRVNIFLSWEGAYRMSLGQTPFEDFGLPMGFAYWLLPTLFFKVMGPTMYTLVKTQVLINAVSILALRGILYNLKFKSLVTTFALITFCLTYVIYNFWPWYNHSVVVFELVAIYFITLDFRTDQRAKKYLSLILAGFFTFISFFTKQDVGGVCLLICAFLLLYDYLYTRKPASIIIYISSFFLFGALFIIPYIEHDFFYWFNYGQAPHSSRISIPEFLNILLAHSLLEKIYLLILLAGVLIYYTSFKEFLKDRKVFYSVTIITALVLQSIVTRITSPLPTDHMNYFHTFGLLGASLFIPWASWGSNRYPFIFVSVLLAFTFSEGYWKYVSGYFFKSEIYTENKTVPAGKWSSSTLPTLFHVTLPEETNSGISRIMDLPFIKDKNLAVLNMSELTSLAHEIGYTPQIHQPLWYHLNIGMFQKEVEEFKEKVKNKKYDLVLFESIPSLTEFYPYEVRSQLLESYVLTDKFLAPRKLGDSTIEVFIHPDLVERYNLKSIYR